MKLHFIIVAQIILFCAFFTYKSCAFNSIVHQDITRNSLSSMVTPETLQHLIFHSVDGDRFYPGKSAAHFDNCCWDEGIDFVLTFHNLALWKVDQNIEDTATIWRFIGYVIHAAEDFYAHSNWIDYNDPGIIASLKQGSVKPGYWRSGVCYGEDCLRCPPGTPTHDSIDKINRGLNKDNPGRQGYHEAFNDAVLEVRIQIRSLIKEFEARAKGKIKLARLGFLDESK